ncbi:MAG: class I SAM-dependent methyltransferase [Gemmatimonadales bacterium]
MTHPGARPASAYDRWSAQYDSDRNPTRDLDARVLRDTPLPLDGARVVELGAGTGKNSVWLAERAAQVIALDLSPGMQRVARERSGSLPVRQVRHDVRAGWPIRTGTADLVVSNLVLEHVEDLTPVFQEAARALAVGGELFLSELHPARQLRGGQAHFTDGRTGETVRVEAFRHSVSDYVNGGIGAGLRLLGLGEWLEPDAPADLAPRLLTLRFAKPAP